MNAIRARSMVCSSAAALILFIGGSRAPADVLTFDDLGPSVFGTPIPSGYGGFNWGNFYYLDPTFGGYGASGYNPAIVSPNNVVFNGFGLPASLFVTSSTSFTFNGAYLTAAWNDGLSVEVQGYNSGNLLYDTTVNPSATSATYFAFNYANVDELIFSSFGGTPHLDYTEFPSYQFAMDNFTFNASAVPVPEPPTAWGLCGICAMGLGIVVYRRKRILAASSDRASPA